MPRVDILHGCAHIPARQIVNHFLALGLEVDMFRAGYEEDWLCNDGEYKCVFMAETHESVKAFLRKDPNMSRDTRVCVIRPWSDAFEAHHIVARNGFNSLQLFTLTLMAPSGKITKRHTLPFALCFKKANSYEIFLELLRETHELEKPTLMYWGKDRQF